MEPGTKVRVAAGHQYAGQAGAILTRLDEPGGTYWLVQFAEDGAEWRCPRLEYLVTDSTPAGKDNAPALVEYLTSIGVSVKAAKGDLAYEAPKGVMTVDLLARIRGLKEGLLALLGRERPMVCFSCGEVIPSGQPAGEGPLMIQHSGHWRFYHLRAGCLPSWRTYNPGTTQVERAS